MRKLLKFVCLIVLPLFILGTLLVASDASFVRFNIRDSVRNTLQTFSGSSGTVDYLFLGASSADCAINPELLAEEYGRLSGNSKVFLQMAEGGGRLDISYAYLEAASSRLTVKTVFVEINERQISVGAPHPWAYQLMPVNFWLSEVTASSTFGDSGKGLSGLLKKLGSNLNSKTYRAFLNNPAPTAIKEHIASNTRSSWGGWGPKHYAAGLSSLSARKGKNVFDIEPDNYADRTIKKIIDLCDKRNIELYFIYIPRLMIPPLDPSVAAKFQQRYGRELVFYPEDTHNELFQAKGWADGLHMNTIGQEIYAKDLARTIYGMEHRTP